MAQKIVRSERSDGIRTREAILNAAAGLATIDGLEGLSIGRLAEHIGLSKSGLYAHFGSKEELQLATIETAYRIFGNAVVSPTLTIEDPVERLEALCQRFLDHLEQRVFPRGCFFSAASAELGPRPGPVSARVMEVVDEWVARLVELIRQAQTSSLIDRREDAIQLAFELQAYLLMANTSFVLHDDPAALERARKAVRRRLNLARTPVSTI